MQSEKRKTGKDWLSFIIIYGGHEISAMFCLCFLHRVYLCDYVDVNRSATHLNLHHHSVVPCPAIAQSYSQRKPAL